MKKFQTFQDLVKYLGANALWQISSGWSSRAHALVPRHILELFASAHLGHQAKLSWSLNSIIQLHDAWVTRVRHRSILLTRFQITIKIVNLPPRIRPQRYRVSFSLLWPLNFLFLFRIFVSNERKWINLALDSSFDLWRTVELIFIIYFDCNMKSSFFMHGLSHNGVGTLPQHPAKFVIWDIGIVECALERALVFTHILQAAEISMPIFWLWPAGVNGILWNFYIIKYNNY